MSNDVDRRVVEMQFDNRDFENNIQTSVQSLSKLKESLKLEESARELKAFEKTASKFSLDGMISAAESMTSKFSAMGTVGDQVLRRLTDSAMTAFYQMKRFVDSLTIDPIYTGFDEYNTQINSIQTILSNTREDLTSRGFDDAGRLGEVTAKLDELNSYADKTIYNFTEMTRNIGTFTAAGVDLYTAVDAIKGIANLAAVSGSTSEQASRAMYQLSQALSSGTVKLMDWNSVVNAGMGGKIFQDALTRTARAMKVTVDKTVTETNKRGRKIKKNVNMTVDQLIEKEGSFRESLSSGWLTADVLTATLEQFSWDFEEMARDEAIKMGKVLTDNLEEEIGKQMEKKKIQLLSQGYTLDEAETIVQLARDAAEAATKVKTIPQLFDTLKEAAQSGWTKTWEFIIGNFEEAKETLSAMGDYFGRLIDISSDSRNVIMQQWHDNGGYASLWNNDEKKGPLGSFWNLVHGIENIVSIIREEFQKVFPPATAQNLLDFTKGIQKATENFRLFTENSEKMSTFRIALKGIVDMLNLVKSGLSFSWKGVKRLFGFVKPVSKALEEPILNIVAWVSSIKKMLEESDDISIFANRIQMAIDSVSGTIEKGIMKIIEWTGKLGTKIAGSDIYKKLGTEISEFIGRIPSYISKIQLWTNEIFEYARTSEKLKTLLDNAKSILSSVTNQLEVFVARIRDAIEAFFNADTTDKEGLFQKIEARLDAFGNVFSGWSESLKKTIESVWADIQTYLRNFFENTIPNFLSKLDSATFDWMKIAKTIVGAYNIYRLLQILKNFSEVGSGITKIGEGLRDIGDGIKNVVENGIQLIKNNKDNLPNTLLKIAGSMAIVVASIYALSKMKTSDIIIGLGVLTIIATELLTISFVFSKVGANGNTFLALAASVTLLIIPISILGNMDTAKALKGIIAISAIMTELGICMRLVGTGKKSGLIGLAISINLLVLAVGNLSNIDGDHLAKGLGGVAALMAAISVVSKSASNDKKLGGFVGLSVGIILLTYAVKKLSELDEEAFNQGVVGLSGLILSLGIMSKTIQGIKLESSIAMLIAFGGSLLIFTEVFKRTKTLNFDDVIKFSLSFASAVTSVARASKKIKITGAVKGVLAMGVWVAGIGGVLMALGALIEKFPTIGDLLTRGGEVLGKIGEAFGKFLKGILGTVFNGFNLPQIGTDLSKFVDNASGFTEGIKKFDLGVVRGVTCLSVALLELAAASVINSILTLVSLGTNPVASFASNIKILGDGLKDYATSVGGISEIASDADLKSSVETAKGLAEVARTIPPDDGIVQKLTGWKDLGKFSLNVVKMGLALKAYAMTISGFSTTAEQEDLSRSEQTANSLSELNAKLPSTGGRLQEFIGEQNLSLFSAQLPGLASALKAYAQNINGFSSAATKDDFVMANKTAISLAVLENSLPETGGTLQKFLGEQDLNDFSTKIVKLSQGLRRYARNIKNFSALASDEDFEKAKNTAQSLSDLQNSLPDTGGIVHDALFGGKDLSQFATNIVKLAGGLKLYAFIIKGFSNINNPNDLKKAEETAQSLSDLNNALPDTGGMMNDLLFGEKDLDLFSTNIVTFGRSLRSFADSVSGISYANTEDAFSVIDVVKEFQDNLESTGGIGDLFGRFIGGSTDNTLINGSATMATFGQNLKIFCDSITNISSEHIGDAFGVLDSFSEYIRGRENKGGILDNIGAWFSGEIDILVLAQKMADFGTNFETFANGISGALGASENFAIVQSLIGVFSTLANSVKNGEIDMDAIIQMASQLGKVFIMSVADFISSNPSEIETSIVDLSEAGITAAQNQQTNWYDAGKYLGQGLCNGIVDMTSSIANAAANAAAGATRAISITWQVHSPSRIGFGLGKNFDLGLIGGIQQFGNHVAQSAQRVGEQTVDSAKTMLRGLDSSIFDDIDPNPTIRPVMDLTSIQNGVGMINGMFQSQQMIGRGLFRGMNAMNGMNHLDFDGSRIVGSTNNKDVVSEIRSLRSRFDDLNQAVTNMKVVLDSGALVGATYTQMDDQLGVLAMHKSRGN